MSFVQLCCVAKVGEVATAKNVVGGKLLIVSFPALLLHNRAIISTLIASGV